MKIYVFVFFILIASSCKTIMDAPYCDESERNRKVEINVTGDKDLYSVSRFWLLNYFVNTPVIVTLSENNCIQGYFFNGLENLNMIFEIKSFFEIKFEKNKILLRIQNPCVYVKPTWFYLKNKEYMDKENLYWSKLITDYTNFINNY